jgi:hypothetical protein
MLSAKRYKGLRQGLHFVPKFLLGIQTTCSECGTSFQPNWLEKRLPLIPKTSLSGGGVDIPIGAKLSCPNCRADVLFPLPTEEQKACYSFFGDEAYRDLNDIYVMTYSLVGTNRTRVPEIEMQIREFKKRLVPSVNPDDWIIHMKEIWPGSQRRKHPLFRDWDRNFIEAMCADLFALINKFDDAFLIHNVSAVFYKPKERGQLKRVKNEVRHNAYTLLLLEIIDNATKYGVAPFFTFDAEKHSNADKIIHGWAKDAFDGSQLNLVYPYVARGIKIPEPTFVKPASHPCLELADFVSYVIARYLFRRITSQTVDLDPDNLGNVTYMCFDIKGDMRKAYQQGYPWKQFFGDV